MGSHMTGVHCMRPTIYPPLFTCLFILLKPNRIYETRNNGSKCHPNNYFHCVWGVVGGILPWFVPKGPNRGVTQTVLVITACSCWLFWLCCYLMQMNPLIGPEIKNQTLLIMRKEWGIST